MLTNDKTMKTHIQESKEEQKKLQKFHISQKSKQLECDESLHLDKEENQAAI